MEFVVPEILEHRARSHPGNPAAVSAGAMRTYRELDRTATRMATDLMRRGIRKGDRVGILLPNSIEAMASIYAVVKCGAIFVPINHRLMREQVMYTVQDCAMACVITSGRYADKLSPAAIRIQDVDALSAAAHAADVPGPPLVGTDLAAILYTSGSTGYPKGVVLTHRNLVTGAHIVSRYLENRAADRIISVLPFAFDYGLNQMFTAHLVGGTLVVPPSTHPKQICETLLRERITGFAGVPTVWVQLLQAYSPFARLAFPDLRYVTNSGGTIPSGYLARLCQVLGKTRIYLMYGLTEAFRSTYLPPEQMAHRPTSIGKAIPNVAVHVLNEDGEECAPDEPGELVHRGANIFAGYWNDPETTARVLRPFPSRPEHVPVAEMAVYSGDIVTRDKEGFLYFVGRKDNLIKCSGYRISPQEVEDILYQVPGVQEAAVIGVPDDLQGQKIMAFVSCAEGAVLCHDDVQAFCSQRLPAYMVPHDTVFRDALPKTPNGKIDRTALTQGIHHAG